MSQIAPRNIDFEENFTEFISNVNSTRKRYYSSIRVRYNIIIVISYQLIFNDCDFSQQLYQSNLLHLRIICPIYTIIFCLVDSNASRSQCNNVESKLNTEVK